MVWPEAFMRLFDDIPRAPRALKRFDFDRRMKLLELATVLVERMPTETSRRTALYLMHLCDLDAVPGPLACLRWITESAASEFDALESMSVLRARPMGRLMPSMALSAKLHRV